MGVRRRCKLSRRRRQNGMMNLELTKQARAAAVGSVQRYFEENFPEPIGNLPAGSLLDFFIEEIGPVIYNKAIADAQARMQQHVVDLNGEFVRG